MEKNNLISKFISFTIPKGKTYLRVTTSQNSALLKSTNKTYNFIIFEFALEEAQDIHSLLVAAHSHLETNGKLIIIYKNFLYEFLNGVFKTRQTITSQTNWLSTQDIDTFLRLCNFSTVTQQPLQLVPNRIPLISFLFNKLLIYFFPLNHLAFNQYIVASKQDLLTQDTSVSIVIPARNEAGTIPKLLKELPFIGKACEIIFVEGHSKDETHKVISEQIKKLASSSPFTFKLIDQGAGRGKADAVRKGFDQASGEILMIYDADMSVKAVDLQKFYLALIQHKGECINGSRLVYPMQTNAMQLLNIFGNKFFSILYSWILGQKIKDTLCGTKVFWKKDYEEMKRTSLFGKYDPFGDFDLLLSCAKLHLRIIDLPVRYYERTYGATNIRRFQNALELFKYSLIAVIHLKMRFMI